MNCIVELNGKFACQQCGNEINVTDKKCAFCKQEFSGEVKTINTNRPAHKPNEFRQHKTRMDIVVEKVRNNRQLVVEDFISVRKLMELKKVDIFI